jgi:hypothetical protein
MPVETDSAVETELVEDAVGGKCGPDAPTVDDFAVRCMRCDKVCDPFKSRLIAKKAEEPKYQCPVCNSRFVTLNRMFGRWPLDDFRKLSREEQTTFYASIADKESNEIKELVVDTFTRRSMEEMVKRQKGSYMPLSWYKKQGFDIDAIVASCSDKKQHPVMGLTYCVEMESKSWSKVEQSIRDQIAVKKQKPLASVEKPLASVEMTLANVPAAAPAAASAADAADSGSHSSKSSTSAKKSKSSSSSDPPSPKKKKRKRSTSSSEVSAAVKKAAKAKKQKRSRPKSEALPKTKTKKKKKRSSSSDEAPKRKSKKSKRSSSESSGAKKKRKKQHEESRRKTDVLRKKEEDAKQKKEAAQQKKDELAMQRDANKALARISPLKSRLDGLMVDPLFNKASSFVQKDAIHFSARLDECFADADNILKGKKRGAMAMTLDQIAEVCSNAKSSISLVGDFVASMKRNGLHNS